MLTQNEAEKLWFEELDPISNSGLHAWVGKSQVMEPDKQGFKRGPNLEICTKFVSIPVGHLSPSFSPSFIYGTFLALNLADMVSKLKQFVQYETKGM